MNLKPLLLAQLVSFLCVYNLYSQCSVVINEVNPNPPPGIDPNPGTANGMTNSFYDSGDVNGPDDDAEWVELYNPNPCQSADISCWIVGSNMTDPTLPVPQYTRDNWFYFTFPAGTVIPPLGHVVVGGHAATNVDFSTKTYINSGNFCSFSRSLLRDSNGWIALYDQNGNPKDAVYWGTSGVQNEINTVPLYANNITVLSSCTCGNQNKTLASVRSIPTSIREFGGRVYTGTDLTIARVPDGGGWTQRNPKTPGSCNGGSCIEPPVISIPNKSVCNGNTTSLQASVSTNGVNSGPYSTLTYKWNDTQQQSTLTATGLGSGNYNFTVTDACGCSHSQSATITELNLVVETSVTVNTDCDRFGGTLGDATVNVTTGSQPYSYAWDDPLNQTSQTATGLSVGSYNVTVTDSKGCTATGAVTIEDKIILDATINASASCQQCSDGSATVNVSGTGVPPFTYRWNDPNEQTTQTATGLAGGTYNVTVTDANGCFTTLNLVTVLVGLEDIDYSFAVELFPNPSSSLTTISFPNFIHKGEVKLYDISGKLVFENQFTERTNFSLDTKVLNTGMYHLVVYFDSKYATKRLLVK